MAPLIGYYAHHHGTGHRNRASLIAAAYPGPVHIIGEGTDEAITVPLPPDVEGGFHPQTYVDPISLDPTANGTLHWAPRHSPLLAPRASAIVDWVRDHQPALVVVDVSVEVAVLVRLLGVPVVYVRQHGDRTDPAHQLAFQLADALLAPYPEWAEDPSATDSMRAKTRYSGGFSRFDQRPLPCSPRDPNLVVVIAGSGGTSLDATSIARLAAAGDRHWIVIGLEGPDGARCEFRGRVEDPWPLMTRAGVVVSSAGHSAVCEAASAGAPTIAVAEPRPFREQEHKVRVLVNEGLAHPAPPLSDTVAWEATLQAAIGTTPPSSKLVDRHGLTRAVDHLVEMATTLAPASILESVKGRRV